jgi:lipopolysaccharide export system permease protein
MKLLDRVLIFNYLKSYLICLSSLLGLYIIVDLFTNLDDFANHHPGLTAVTKAIVNYYGYKIPQIFDRLCEPIVLLAAMFTVAMVQRSNELLPLLSAGVSTRRVVRPVLFSACLMLGLSTFNQEMVIPNIADRLTAQRDDPDGHKEFHCIQGGYEPNGIHIEGLTAIRKEHLVRQFDCFIPDSVAGGNPLSLHAKEARWIKPTPTKEPRTAGWLLTETTPAQLDHWNQPQQQILEMINPGKYFLHVEEVDFDTITRDRKWYLYASTPRLLYELNKPDSTRLADMAVAFHMRLTRPILGMILVFLGLSVILRDQNRNVFISAAMCLGLCAFFFGACFACQQLGSNNIVSPALAAWAPVLFFGPLAFVLFDAIHT